MTKVTSARMGEQPEPGAVPEKARNSERRAEAQHRGCCASSFLLAPPEGFYNETYKTANTAYRPTS
jgi:hypothetical protein